LALQSKLLQLLQDGQFCRIGAQEDKKVEVRIVCATNRKLEVEIESGTFRQDLFYRINVVNLQLPPLRERRDDIPLLVDYFVAKYARKYNRSVVGASPEVMELWISHDWPGNVRELQNSVNQAVLLCPGGVIDLPTVMGAQVHAALPREPCKGDGDDIDVASFGSLKELRDAVTARYERRLIEIALGSNGGNRTKTAEALGVTRKTLADKMAEYEIEVSNRGGRT
jgi:DNA-binding NtrC family response regulator